MKLTKSHLRKLIKEELQEATYQTRGAMDMANDLCRTSMDSSECDDFFAASQADHWIDIKDDRKEINNISLQLRKQYSNNWMNMVIDLMDILVKLKCALAAPHIEKTTQKEIKIIVSVIKKILRVEGEIQCSDPSSEIVDDESHADKVQAYRDIGYGEPSRD